MLFPFRRRFFFFLVIGVMLSAFTPLGVLADCDEDGDGDSWGILVKSSHDSYYFVADDDCEKDPSKEIVAIEFVYDGFYGDPIPSIWPNADSESHTNFPISNVQVADADGEIGYEGLYHFETYSLHDLGIYDYVVGGFWGDAYGNTGPLYANILSYFVGNSPPEGSISISGGTHVDESVAITAYMDDEDGGFVTRFKWNVIDSPSGSVSSLIDTDQSQAHLPVGSHHDIGDWEVRLKFADDEGQMEQQNATFTVENQEPDISIDGPIEVEATDPLQLECGPGTDPDHETLSLKWDVVSGPQNASPGVGNNVFTGPVYSITTGAEEIGDWNFRCHTEDAHGGSDQDTHQLTVLPKPPEIDLVGATEIDVGESIDIETTILDDAYGEPLTFNWRLIQVPESAGESLGDNFSNSAQVSFVTSASDAGTWGFRLTVTDHIGETAEEEIYVLVDAFPEAEIVGPDVDSNIITPIVLDGSGSVDPDTPEGPPDYGHLHEGPAQVSEGLVHYTWSLLDVPPEYYGEVYPGPVTDVLSINGNSAVLNIPANTLKPGYWYFELQVTDAEGNDSWAEHALQVLDPSMPPLALTGGPQYTPVSSAGVTPVNIGVDGSASFDPDNLLTDPFSVGIGLTNYSWTIPVPAVGCGVSGVLASGPSASFLPLYTAGQTVPDACQGVHTVQLTVTDDDTPTAKTGIGFDLVMIGNCEGNICIDSPTQDNPEFVKFSEDTDILIFYHMDSVFYDMPEFVDGLWAEVEIYHESDVTTPVFSDAFDLDMLPSNKGVPLAFHWSGFTNGGTRPEPGLYTVRIGLADGNGILSDAVAEEIDSIWIQVLDITTKNTSTKYVNRGKLPTGDKLQLHYDVVGNDPGDVGFDQLITTIKNKATNGTVISINDFGPFTSTVTWNGDLGGGVIVGTGVYTATMEMFENGTSLGKTEPWEFTVYSLSISASTGPVTDKFPGLFMMINHDDDNANLLPDSLETLANDDELRTITVSLAPPIPGVLFVTSTATGVSFFGGPGKSNPLGFGPSFASPGSLPVGPITIEAQSAGRTHISAQLQTSEGLILGPTFFAMTAIDVRMTRDDNNNFQADATDARRFFIEPGLWDNAFRLAADAFGVVDSLFNENDQTRRTATGNPENFVGRDSNRFYIQIEDPSANLDPAVVEELLPGRVEWYTLLSSSPRINDGFPPGQRSLHLRETGPNTGLFVSEALMLVSAPSDEIEPTNTGITAHPGTPGFNQHNHRLRKMSSIKDLVGVNYVPAAANRNFELLLPTFARNPNSLRFMNVRVFNFGDPLNLGHPFTSTAAIAVATTTFAEVYRNIGIDARIQYNPATDNLSLPAGSPINLTNVGSFSQPTGFPSLTPSADQAALIALVRAVEPATPANANTLYVVYIRGFSGGNRGESFPDGFNPAIGAEQNFVFINGASGQIDYVPAHEVGHMLTNGIGMNLGRATGTEAGWQQGGHYGPIQMQFNVMDRFGGSHSTPHDITDAARYWNDTAVHLFAQINLIRLSRFVQGP